MPARRVDFRLAHAGASAGAARDFGLVPQEGDGLLQAVHELYARRRPGMSQAEIDAAVQAFRLSEDARQRKVAEEYQKVFDANK